MRARTSRSPRAGMTLVELLAALAIFIGIAGMIIQVLGGGLDMWSTGERTRDDSEQATALLDRVALELRHAVSADGGDGEPRVKMLCDVISIDIDGDGTRECLAQRLIFVRQLFEERTVVALRDAGSTPGGQLDWIGQPRVAATELFATEGRVESAFVPQPDLRKGYEGRLVLWRGLKSPIGGKQSLFARARNDPSGLEGALLEPVAEDVLYFGLAFIDPSVSDPGANPDVGGPLVVWDSTRGILPAGEGYLGFRHARGPTSLENPDDDVFPEAVRITVIVAPPPSEAPQTVLGNEMQSTTTSVRVEVRSGQQLRQLGSSLTPMKIGHEWLEAGDSDGVSMAIGRRGLFGTLAAAHAPGAPILHGRRFERIVILPSPRSDYADRELSGKRK